VEHLSNQFLAHAALSLQQDRNVGLRHLPGPVDDVLNGVGLPDDAEPFLNRGSIHKP
jgi:hypothetical protein